MSTVRDIMAIVGLVLLTGGVWWLFGLPAACIILGGTLIVAAVVSQWRAEP